MAWKRDCSKRIKEMKSCAACEHFPPLSFIHKFFYIIYSLKQLCPWILFAFIKAFVQLRREKVKEQAFEHHTTIRLSMKWATVSLGVAVLVAFFLSPRANYHHTARIPRVKEGLSRTYLQHIMQANRYYYVIRSTDFGLFFLFSLSLQNSTIFAFTFWKMKNFLLNSRFLSNDADCLWAQLIYSIHTLWRELFRVIKLYQ